VLGGKNEKVFFLWQSDVSPSQLPCSAFGGTRERTQVGRSVPLLS